MSPAVTTCVACCQLLSRVDLLKRLHAGHAGSMNMSYDSSNLTTPDIKWLGVRPSDLDRFNIPEQCRLPMTEEDMKTGKRLVGEYLASEAILCCILLNMLKWR